MIENYRSQLLWNNFMTAPEIAPILDYSNPKGLFFQDATDVKDEKIPNEFKLNQNYPNPFNPDTIISYQLSASSPVSLKIYDLLGREISTLVNEFQDAGIYNVRFKNDISSHSPASGGFIRAGGQAQYSSLSTGIYLYTLQAGNYSQTKKMVFLR
ncbi:MAG: T9SS type A sorting domain-containing protein [Melioribacteraceae bacterium]|nr:T9SS type A sorting domain-containing protein [Melioribacteraceae bacterium]